MTRPKLSDLNEQADELRGRIAFLANEKKAPQVQISNIDRQASKLQAELRAVEQQINAAKEAPRVSDHAVMRYLERKHGFDFEKVRAGLLTDSVRAAMDAGAEGLKIPGGSLRFKGKTITTFIPAAGKRVEKADRSDIMDEALICDAVGNDKTLVEI